MYLRDLAASLLRRWHLFCVALLITVAACYGVVRLIGPTYSASAGVVLLPPPDPENPYANRFLSLGSLKQATDVLVRSLGSDATHRDASAGIPGGDYSVEPDFTTSAPVLVVTATGPTRAAASQMLKNVVARVPVNLGRLQGALDIKKSDQIVYEVLATDQTPELVVKGQLRGAAGVGVMLFGALCLLIGALDGALLRRRQQNAGIRAIPDVVDDTDEATPPLTPATAMVADMQPGDGVPQRRSGRRR